MKKINRSNTSKKIQENKSHIELRFRELALLTSEELFTQIASDQNGLSTKEVKERQEDFGKNIITLGSNNTLLHRLLEAVINPFNVILLIIAGITYFTDVIASQKPDYLGSRRNSCHIFLY